MSYQLYLVCVALNIASINKNEPIILITGRVFEGIDQFLLNIKIAGFENIKVMLVPNCDKYSKLPAGLNVLLNFHIFFKKVLKEHLDLLNESKLIFRPCYLSERFYSEFDIKFAHKLVIGPIAKVTYYPVKPYFKYGGLGSGMFVILSNVFDTLIGLYTNLLKAIITRKALVMIFGDKAKDINFGANELFLRQKNLIRVFPSVTFQTFFPRSVFSKRAEKCLTKPMPKLSSVYKIVWCGTFEKRKLFGLFFEIVKKINTWNGFLFEIIVIGEGPELQFWKNKALVEGVKINFTGQISNDMVSEYFTNAALLVSTSLRDLDPNIILESILAGTRFVCFSRILSNTSWFQNHGTLIDGNQDDLIQCFLNAIKSEFERYTMNNSDSKSRNEAVLDLLQSVSVNNQMLSKILNEIQ